MKNLRVEETLDQIIFDEGIALEYVDLSVCDGVYYRSRSVISPVILIDKPIKNTRMEKIIKAHELGHHFTSTCDLISAPSEKRRREESRALRWQTNKLLSPEKLIAAYERGCRSIPEFIEYFDFPPEEFMKGLNLLNGIYGIDSLHCGYRIYWEPFNIKKTT